ncbi:hypothetical protein ACMATS_06040 [Streptoverticillium reticulum]|uniref:hypothetical protein n=1 Tax=Streptoverticillium reticulum TaxID=1433415 RepID=UPI0039BED8A0
MTAASDPSVDRLLARVPAPLRETGLWARPFQLENPTNSERFADGVVWPDGRVTVACTTGAPGRAKAEAHFNFASLGHAQYLPGMQHLVPVWEEPGPADVWVEVGQVRVAEIPVADFCLMPMGSVAARWRTAPGRFEAATDLPAFMIDHDMSASTMFVMRPGPRITRAWDTEETEGK